MAQVGKATLAELAAGILGGGIRVVDLTVPLEPATPTIQLPPQFAPSQPFSMEEISKYDQRGPAWYWNNIACGEHTGTHFDAPIHWVTGKDYPNNATHNIPVQKFIGPACVIDVSARVRENADFLVTVEVVQAWEQQHGEIPRGAWVLIRTDWSKRTGAERFLNIGADGRIPLASIRSAYHSWRRSATFSASASRRSAPMRGRRRRSIRCSRATRSCTARTASGSRA
jgi:kynurenine formamidase